MTDEYLDPYIAKPAGRSRLHNTAEHRREDHLTSLDVL